MAPTPVLSVKGLTKRFGGTLAVSGVSIDFFAGSCHALVGENGAGKSTLGKMIGGIVTPDEGEIFLGGSLVRLSSPAHAQELGIRVLHQELIAFDNLTVAENLYIGRLPANFGFVDGRRLQTGALDLLKALAPEIDPNTPFRNLSPGMQQAVLLSAAVAEGAKIIVFDEPTSSLSEGEAKRLFERIEWLKEQGVCCIYVSHRMREVFALCDTISVLRDGHLVTTSPATALEPTKLVELMSSKSVAKAVVTESRTIGKVALAARGLAVAGRLENFNLELKEGEIVGLAGLVGAGRSEALGAIFGTEPASGDVQLNGQKYAVRSPQKSLSMGLGLVPEDRKLQGLILQMSVQSNATLSSLPRLFPRGLLGASRELQEASREMARVGVKAASPHVAAQSLSGGNQQKVVLLKALLAQCKVLLLDEPTRGVDINAKTEIANIIRQLASEGAAILMVSSELPELMDLADRIVVLRQGKVTLQSATSDLTEQAILSAMMD